MSMDAEPPGPTDSAEPLRIEVIELPGHSPSTICDVRLVFDGGDFDGLFHFGQSLPTEIYGAIYRDLRERARFDFDKRTEVIFAGYSYGSLEILLSVVAVGGGAINIAKNYPKIRKGVTLFASDMQRLTPMILEKARRVLRQMRGY
jgi:hypothetical protein